VVARSLRSRIAGVAVGTGSAAFAGWAAWSCGSWLAGGAGASVLAWWSGWAAWSAISGLAWLTGWAWGSWLSLHDLSLLSWGALLARWAGWSGASVGTAWATISWLAVSAWVSWLTVISWLAGWAGGSLGSGGRFAGALGWESERWVAGVFGVWSGWSDVSDVAGNAVSSVDAGLSSWAGGSALASAAAAVRLTLGALAVLDEDTGILVHDGGAGDAGRGWAVSADLDLEHLLPHIAGARLAEVELELNVRFQRLHIVEDKRERH
jgi:hypothetical protein